MVNSDNMQNHLTQDWTVLAYLSCVPVYFHTKYKVRADYEHFLWCLYEAKAKAVYMPLTVASYEGGGYSETKTGLKRSRQEHQEIVGKYIPAKKVRKYRLTMLLTLAPLRTWFAGNKLTAGIYQKIKKILYSGKRIACKMKERRDD